MRSILICVLFICSTSLLAQKTKRVNIYEKAMRGEFLTVHYYYNANDSITNISISLSCQNNLYSELVDVVTLFNGTPIEIRDYFKSIVKFVSENDDGDSKFIFGYNIDIKRSMGIKLFNIWSKDASGMHTFSLKHFSSIMDEFERWALKNKI